MEPEEKKKPVWAYLLSPIFVICLSLLLSLGCLGILRFGNPQWNKWIFIFQAYYWPARGNDIQIDGALNGPYDGRGDEIWITPPKNFTGIIRNWRKNGEQYFEAEFKNGELDGQVIFWYENGNIGNKKYYEKGEVNGELIRWYSNGKIDYKEKFDHGLLIDRIEY